MLCLRLHVPPPLRPRPFQTCKACHQHQWCTNHDESKYEQYTSGVQSLVDATWPGVATVVNDSPGSEYQLVRGSSHALLNTGLRTYRHRTTQASMRFPRLGAFEVSVNGQVRGSVACLRCQVLHKRACAYVLGVQLTAPRFPTQVVYSKLKKGAWPNMDLLVGRLSDAMRKWKGAWVRCLPTHCALCAPSRAPVAPFPHCSGHVRRGRGPA